MRLDSQLTTNTSFHNLVIVHRFSLSQVLYTLKGSDKCLYFFLFSFCVSCCPCNFKLEYSECVQTMKAQTKRPRR